MTKTAERLIDGGGGVVLSGDSEGRDYYTSAAHGCCLVCGDYIDQNLPRRNIYLRLANQEADQMPFHALVCIPCWRKAGGHISKRLRGEGG